MWTINGGALRGLYGYETDQYGRVRYDKDGRPIPKQKPTPGNFSPMDMDMSSYRDDEKLLATALVRAMNFGDQFGGGVRNLLQAPGFPS